MKLVCHSLIRFVDIKIQKTLSDFVVYNLPDYEISPSLLFRLNFQALKSENIFIRAFVAKNNPEYPNNSPILLYDVISQQILTNNSAISISLIIGFLININHLSINNPHNIFIRAFVAKNNPEYPNNSPILLYDVISQQILTNNSAISISLIIGFSININHLSIKNPHNIFIRAFVAKNNPEYPNHTPILLYDVISQQILTNNSAISISLIKAFSININHLSINNPHNIFIRAFVAKNNLLNHISPKAPMISKLSILQSSTNSKFKQKNKEDFIKVSLIIFE